MKALHLTTAVILTLLICFMAGCGTRTVPPGERFVVSVINETGADVYAIRLAYALGSKTLGSVEGCHADNSPIKPGDSMSFEFLREDFPENADLSQLSLQLQAFDPHHNASTPKIPITVAAVYGGSYEIRLSGSHAQQVLQGG